MSSDGKPRHYRKVSLSDSEIMTILIVFKFGSFRNFKYSYLFFIRQHMKASFSNAVSYNRVVELKNRVFFQMTFFLNLSAFGYWRHTASLTTSHMFFRDIALNTPNNLCYFNSSYPELGYIYKKTTAFDHCQSNNQMQLCNLGLFCRCVVTGLC